MVRVDARVGDRLAGGRFRLDGQLGSGGMGVVFRAYDESLGRHVALKTLRDADPGHVYRLKREFRNLAGLSHPNLIQLYELFALGDDCFFTMELLEGRDLLDHVGVGDGPVDLGAAGLARLRQPFRQITAGLRALHAAGQLHRDVKPSNVIVLEDARTVLLDFGLAAPLRPTSPDSAVEGLVGTLSYVAPEVAWAGAAREASDWYSLGVVLYQALTGRLPFEGSIPEILEGKRSEPVPRPSDRRPGVPSELDTVVAGLLDPDPESRAGPAELLEALEVPGAPLEVASPTAALPEAPFVGRSPDLARLQSALDEARAGTPVVARVLAPSGMGKTELVRRFLESAVAREAETPLALHGRCHPQESVPFKALDSLMDELSRYLVRLDRHEALALAPRHTRALIRLFPVLERVPALAKWPEGVLAVEPHELRRQGAQALRELLGRIADRRPLVLWIDDAHWGDRDSAPLIRELLRAPDAPRLLLVLSYRREDAPGSPLLEEIDRIEEQVPVRHHRIELSPLDAAETEALAQALLAGTGRREEGALRAVVDESAGSPFLVGEMVRHLTSEGPSSGLRVADVVGSRVRRLPETMRTMLEFVAVAGGPADLDLVLDLAGAGRGQRPLAYDLCSQCLLRSGAPGDRETVEIYHDRIRETVLEQLDPPLRARRHREIADALRARPDPDPQVLVGHYLGAGDEALAARYALEGGDRSARALAFDQAADLYDLALRLRGGRDEDWPIRVKRAESLARAGRCSQAGDVYEDAARDLGRLEGDRLERVALRGRAAEQHFYGGRLERGLETLHAALGELDVPMPRTAPAAIRTALAFRLRFLLRGFDFTPRLASEIPDAELVRLDALWGAAKGTANLDHTLSDAFQSRHLLAALRLGEPSRVLRALGLEACTEANLGGGYLRRRARRLLGEVARLRTGSRDPYDAAWSLSCHGAVAWFSASWRECVEFQEESIRILRTECSGAAWEMAVIQVYLFSALAQLGRIRELSARLPPALADAWSRGDLFSLNVLRAGDAVIVSLARDDPESAIESAEQSRRTLPTHTFTSQHYTHLVSRVQAHLYVGDVEAAWRWIEESWDPLGRAGFLRLDYIGVQLRHLRARSALALAARGGAGGWTPARLARVAGRESRQIARSSLPNAEPMARAVEAGLSALRGDRVGEVEALRAAAEGFARADMALFRAGVGVRLGDRGDAEAGATARAWMASESIVQPERMAAMLVPGAASEGRVATSVA